MADSDPSDADFVRSQLQQLQTEFLKRLPSRFVEIRAVHGSLDQDGWDQAGMVTLHRLVHSLTGAAGTFGLADISVAARRLENQLNQALRLGALPGPEEWASIGKGIEHLAGLALARPRLEPERAPTFAWSAGVDQGARVHLVVDDQAHSDVLRVVLLESGYSVVQHDNLASFRQSFLSASPGPGEAVVLDVEFAADDPGGAHLFSELGLGRHGRMPVVTGIGDGALEARLAASRAGASHTLLRPMDPVRLTGMLDVLTGRRPKQPYRVLLVDDDPLLLEAQASVLRAAGMEVHTLSAPLQTLNELDSFSPDVLLLDVYMPEASGPELAAALRESDAYVHLPILFLSAETDLTQQLLALNLGGDDFLVKPVQPEHLVAAVTARARRARQASALRERLQTTLYEREREHLALDQHAIVSITDGQGQITYANDLFCRVSGYARRELLGKRHKTLVSDTRRSGIVRQIWNTISSGKVWHGEVCCLRSDGDCYWVEATVTPFLDEAGAVYQCVAIQTDISHIKATEAALRSQRDMQRVISVAAARLMAATGGQTNLAIDAALKESGAQLGADRAYLFRFSKDGASMTNTHAWNAEGIPPMSNRVEDLPTETTPWMKDQFLRHGRVLVQRTDAMPPEAQADQSELLKRGLRSLVVFPLTNNNQPIGFIGYSGLHDGSRSPQRLWTPEEVELLKVLADVVSSALSRNIAESKLRRSEARLNFLVSSSPVAIYTRDARPPFALSFVSPNILQLVGVEASLFAEDANQNLGLVHPDDLARVSHALPSVLTHDADLCEYRMRRADGGYLWVQDQRRLVRDSAGAPLEIIGCWLDITERKRFEGELSAFNQELERRVEEQTRDVLSSERLAQGTLDALSSRVVILDAEGDIVAANRAWCGFFGGRSPESVGNYLRYCDEMDRASERETATYLAPGLRAVLRGVQRSHVQEYGQQLDGEQRWFVCRIERFGTEEDPRCVVSHEDITALKQAERAQLRSQRLESLGTLAGGVAHDLNNALAPVLMGMNILKEQYPEESRLFEMIEASAQRGTHMVRQLLTFAKGADGARVLVCPGQVVHEIERLMKGSFPKNIELRIENPEGLPGLVGDPTQLHQVLLNLCVNARDAMPGGGTLTVQLQQVEIDAHRSRSIPDAAPGRYVTLQVSDTGSGIPPEILDRIFDPFFTTKAADKGTGLGLSTVLGIVKGHGGFVQVHSRQEEGTVFTVYLPAAAPDIGEILPAPVEAKAVEVRGHGETVLFVDDESAVREVGRTVLERLHYKALVATDGADGLVLAVDHMKDLSVVITDLHMPNMDGLAFVKALRRVLPDIPVVLASGRVDESLVDAFKALGVTHRLDKPFTEAQLAKQLHAVLNPAAAGARQASRSDRGQ